MKLDVTRIGGVLANLGKRRNSVDKSTLSALAPNEILHAVGTREATRKFMLYVMLPFWLAPGLSDWACHRKTKIEETSGVVESALHAVMMSEVGFSILLGLFFEINPTVIKLMFLSTLAHELTSYLDTKYSSTRREIIPVEQMTHSFLEVMPIAAFSFICCFHWDQVAAIFGKSKKTSEGFKLKGLPSGAGYRAKILAAVFLFVILPFAEEFYRCAKTARKRQQGLAAGADVPEDSVQKAA